MNGMVESPYFSSVESVDEIARVEYALVSICMILILPTETNGVIKTTTIYVYKLYIVVVLKAPQKAGNGVDKSHFGVGSMQVPIYVEVQVCM